MDEVILGQDLFLNVLVTSITITPVRHIHSCLIRKTVKGLAHHMPQSGMMSHTKNCRGSSVSVVTRLRARKFEESIYFTVVRPVHFYSNVLSLYHQSIAQY